MHKERIGVRASAAQCQHHFMGDPCEHMVLSVCEKVTGRLDGGWGGWSTGRQPTLLSKTETVELQNCNFATKERLLGCCYVCFSLRKTAICLNKHVLPMENQKCKMRGYYLLGNL